MSVPGMSVKSYGLRRLLRVMAKMAVIPTSMAVALPHSPDGAGLPGVDVGGLAVAAAGGELAARDVGVATTVGDGLRVGSTVAVGGICTA